jgi:hypothetical protein
MPSDEVQVLSIIHWGIFFSLLVVVILIVGVIYLQITHYYQAKLQKRYLKFLQSYFHNFLTNNSKRKILIKKENFFTFISFWSSSFNSSDIDSQKKLISMAVLLGLPDLCLKKLSLSKKIFSSINMKKTCLIIHTLGNIFYNNKKSTSFQKELEYFTHHEKDIVAFEASIALLKIDSNYYAPIILNEIISRDNWNNKELKHLMHFFNSSDSFVKIFDLVENCTPDNEKRIIQIASTTNYFPKFVRHILENIKKYSIDSLCLAIKNIDNIDDFNLIESLKLEDNWIYQVSIIQAISNLHYFSEQNLNYLLNNLSNNNWWVRNRSAQAIVQYFGNDFSSIDNLIETLDDNFAKDSLVGALNQYKIQHTYDFI